MLESQPTLSNMGWLCWEEYRSTTASKTWFLIQPWLQLLAHWLEWCTVFRVLSKTLPWILNGFSVIDEMWMPFRMKKNLSIAILDFNTMPGTSPFCTGVSSSLGGTQSDIGQQYWIPCFQCWWDGSEQLSVTWVLPFCNPDSLSNPPLLGQPLFL